MSIKRRRLFRPVPGTPPELLEGDGHDYGEVTGPGGCRKYFLVAETFLELTGRPRLSPLHRARHINGDKQDIRPANLRRSLPSAAPEPSDV